MPEQLTKYPDVTIEVLQSAGAVCGKGVEQKILTKCPKERFCSLPGGEMCIYGLDEIPNMTQITVQELAEAIAPLTGKPAASSTVSGLDAIIMAAVFAAGLGLGRIKARSGTRGS